MTKILALAAAIIWTVIFAILALNRGSELPQKALLGGIWGSVVFWSAYFGLRSIEKRQASPEFALAKKEFDGLVAIGMPVEQAEAALRAVSKPGLVTYRRYFGSKYGNRNFRVSEFDGRVCSIRLLSIDEKVFEIQSEPK